MHAHSHDHNHSHAHAHPDPSTLGTKRLTFAVALNLLLTVAQVIGGLVAGSLALVADALHNFSDAAALILTLVARRIAGKPADENFTFGYRRAEVVAALINLTAIILISAYLVMEAVIRFFQRPHIDGWIVVIVAGVALVVDVATAMLTFAMSKGNLNVRAAFIHNVGDALASVGVIVAGTLIILFDWYWADLAATLVISAYLIRVSWDPMKRSIAILMQGVPRSISLEEVGAAIGSVEGVEGVHHVHVWPLDENDVSIEAHVVIADDALASLGRIKGDVRRVLAKRFSIEHTTLEIELAGENCADEGLVVEHGAGGAGGR